jgi:SAM-dependent methyltransferase
MNPAMWAGESTSWNSGLSPSAEKRFYPRVACRLTVVSDQSAIEGVITDLSLKGMRIATTYPLQLGATYQISFRLPAFPRPIRVESSVTHRTSDRAVGEVAGFRIQNVTLRDTRSLKQFILEQMSVDQHKVIQKTFRHLSSETIRSFTDKSKIEALFSKAASKQSPFTVVQEDKAQAVTCFLRNVSQQRLEFSCQDDYIKRNFSLECPVFVAFSSDFNSYHFESTLLETRSHCVLVQSPDSLFFSEKRSRARELVEDRADLYLEIPVPYPQGKTIKREVLDLSSTGISFRASAEESYFLPGTPLEEVRIVSDGRSLSRETAQVKHITPLFDMNTSAFLKIGLEFGIDRQKSSSQPELRLEAPARSDRRRQERRGLDRRQGVLHNFSELTRRIASQGIHFYRRRWLGLSEPIDREPLVDLVTYENGRHEEIVAILNTTSGRRERTRAPVIVIPPAYGRRKETSGNLALTLIENFKLRQRDLIVLRFDGVRSVGESYKDPSCRFEGKEMINLTLSQGVDDILATLDFVDDNPRFEATEIILVSFSLGSCLARRSIVADNSKRVGYWISVWGATDAQEAIRNATGGVDFIGNYQKGVSCGITNVLGHLIDNDRFCCDAIRSGMAFLEDAKRDMARIDIPVSWLYGSFDDWINPSRIRDIMRVKARGTREVIELPTGHMPTTNEEAQLTYELITKSIWRYLFLEDIEAYRPSSSAAINLRNAEWSRTSRSSIQDQEEYWEKYLLGQGPLEIGFDVLAETDEYREFMGTQIELLDIQAGEAVADMGSGTGLFHQILLSDERNRRLFRSLNGSRPLMLTVDLVHSALEKSKQGLSQLVTKHLINESAFSFQAANLEVSRLKPIWRFLNGQYFSVAKFKGKIEGLTDSSIDLWLEEYSEFLHEVLRGKVLRLNDVRQIHRKFSSGEAEILLDMNRAARFVQKQLRPEDFRDPGEFGALLENGELNYASVDTGILRFEKLNFRKSLLTYSLPFRDGRFDKILSSIVLSYLFNPDESVEEFYRMLKPGGSLVISTFRPDVDMSRVYTRLVKKVEADANYRPPKGLSPEEFLAAVRAFANSAAFLLHLEEEGHFKFFSRVELRTLLEMAGFENIRIEDSFGYPPQAYIAVCSKPSGD